jgi:pimeloyl-ACP methyl ester carboxylesterase
LEALRSEVIVDGKQLEVLEYRSAHSGIERAAVVMLHEGLGSVSMWRDFPQRLARMCDRRVIVYSRYGHGASEALRESRPAEFMHHEGEVVLPELLERVGTGNPILLGHSDGGSIALLYAAKCPKAITGLILEAPHVFVEEVTVKSIASLRESFASMNLNEKLARHHDHPHEMFRAWTEIWLDPAFRQWNIEDRLPAVQCPVLLIQGEDDEYGTRAQIDAISQRVPKSTSVMLANCGHSPHRDQPEAVLKAIAEFIEPLQG